MISVIQRVSSASILINGDLYSSINQGLLILLGICSDDDELVIRKNAEKIAYLRIFADKKNKMNLSVKDVKGEILVVSQFTLCADTKKGNRPSFISAMEPKKAEEFYELFISEFKDHQIPVKSGVFGAMMDVELVNDGPVTIII
ncbi:D-tyrosyl-tRNA(Tyr) deacylase [Candidatus Roizmanbacteria bacterium RIFCSPHIGHO2_02_FULL_37_13b]|uniref:D-aminoacyl-tRNA deacylase n=1 Tax=Candidatus Roizmanbacteria bacterium RIFCSPLOWO2_02_FULL_36_11 TaxID=1802071 RepID=A0A1F7JCI0_9BACT|nr:MAG: D-tyrosyl-tRNA(Tyr) deacylase [Candidatus Roizmanbacteria bacterium RIFCSPHIGHO2_02_FULL_37_13b]OGK53285.1 MAG: D-tyrosyl-tRNA(Tyr) deacylase [Candidatus Roizmanbacteria bacterium RIFCSPLOWO2_02_FULL_36_11]